VIEEKGTKEKGTEEYDSLNKIKPLYTDLITTYKKFYQPNQHVSIDKRQVATKSQIRLKQYAKAKPTRVGL